jgi:serine/threonine-protein kinase
MQVVRTVSSSSAEAYKKPGFKLPPALLDKAVTRLCFVSVISAVSTAAFLVTFELLQPEVASVQRHPLFRLTQLALILVSVAFVVIQRTGVFSKQTILHFGAVFQVLVAFGIAICETGVLTGPRDPVIGVSAAALWLLLCGIIIPATPLMNLFAGTLSALAWPAAYFITQGVFDYEFIGWNRIAVWVMPLALCAFWTNFLNRRIYAMELKSQRAEELGSYTLEKRIGQGGMGEVWRARHRMLARDAAIKLIRPEVVAGQNMRSASLLRRRFEREAQATASLRSPHTVALYDFGVSKDGAFFYVMELLNGIDLQTLVEKYGPMKPGRVKRILIQICDSLEEAHNMGLVHRDIKPRNVIVGNVGGKHDFAKVLDFGLVKCFGKECDATMTLDGVATGTPAYMAPEIAMGRRDIDGRSDIYSLGCVAYFLLTGELVFSESSPTATALAHVQKNPVPPSQRTELPIPSSLERIILRCLEKDPEKRPASAAELAFLLEAAADIPSFDRHAAEEWWAINLPGQSTAPILHVPDVEAEELPELVERPTA